MSSIKISKTIYPLESSLIPSYSYKFPNLNLIPLSLPISGRPAPRVTWWQDNVEISSQSHPSAEEGVQAIVNQLFIGRVTREYLGAKLQCRAQGSKLVGAIVKEVTVQVHCESTLPLLLLSALVSSVFFLLCWILINDSLRGN